jgi:NTE family protein
VQLEKRGDIGEGKKVENVLVLQGGGSLGAFGCGVFKTLAKSGIRFDLVGGTSIGAANAAIICGSRTGDPARDLEDFWMEVARSSYSFFPDAIAVPYYDFEKRSFSFKKLPTSAFNSVVFAVPKMFLPRWMVPGELGPADFASPPSSWTHYYSHAPLARMLEKYVDFAKLSPKGTGPRLVITAVNVLTARTLRFDSARMQIEPKHVLASCAYSAYGFPWVEVEPGVYAWDGGLLSNTPLKEVVEA